MIRIMLRLIGAVLAAIFIWWLLKGGSVNCRESFWDKDTKVIEIKQG